MDTNVIIALIAIGGPQIGLLIYILGGVRQILKDHERRLADYGTRIRDLEKGE